MIFRILYKMSVLTHLNTHMHLIYITSHYSTSIYLWQVSGCLHLHCTFLEIHVHWQLYRQTHRRLLSHSRLLNPCLRAPCCLLTGESSLCKKLLRRPVEHKHLEVIFLTGVQACHCCSRPGGSQHQLRLWHLWKREAFGVANHSFGAASDELGKPKLLGWGFPPKQRIEE